MSTIISRPENSENGAPPTQIGEDCTNMVVMTEVGFDGQGSMFGEKAIKYPKLGRAVSVRCTRNCIFLVLNGRDYIKYVSRYTDKRNDEKIAFLRSTPIFKSVSKALARNALKH